MKDYVTKDIFYDKTFEDTYSMIQNDIKNANIELPSSIKFSENFAKTGKQGLLGILKYKNKGTKNQIVYKISQYMNYLIEQENTVMLSLNRLRKYCPNFCKGYGKLQTSINPDFRKVENPFETDKKYRIQGDSLLMEWINPTKKLYRYLKNESVSEDVVFSLIKQTLLAIQLAQNKVQFTHYDLHSNNILIKKCNSNSVCLYILDKENVQAVPTFGNYPIIIDYGFSYTGDMEGNPLYSALPHTDVGFMSDRFDAIADPKLFLVTVSDELKNYRKSKTSKMFRKLVRNIFKPLKIDWESGWDNTHDVSASDYVINILEDTEKGSKSKFFKHCGHYCIDIMQKLISLPLKPNKYKKIEKMYDIIIDEFRKIEKEIGSDFYNLYIFREMINIADELKNDYMDDDIRDETVRKFKKRLLNTIDSIAKFCNPKLDFEKLLCSLYIFSRQMEGVLYEVMEERMKVKNKEYHKMKIHYANEMYEAIEVNIPTQYQVDSDTIIYIYDAENEVSRMVKVPIEYLEELNSLSNLERSRYLYQLYNSRILVEIFNESIFRKSSSDDDSDEETVSKKDSRYEQEEVKDDDDKDDEEPDNLSESEKDDDEDNLSENESESDEEEDAKEDDDNLTESDDYSEEEDDDLFDEDMDGSDVEKILSKIK